jgi:hypothetical protein
VTIGHQALETAVQFTAHNIHHFWNFLQATKFVFWLYFNAVSPPIFTV